MLTKQFETTSETEIIDRIKEGETGLFEILIRRNNPFLYKIGRAYGYNHQDVEDLMQETFISAYLNFEKFRQHSSFKTWVIKIMLNYCYHKRQRHSFKNERSVDANNEGIISFYENKESTDGYKKIIDRELSHVIEEAIVNIPMDYRIVFSLRELNGMSTAETAEKLEISVANVKTRFSRARQLLRQQIGKIYDLEKIFEFNLIYCDSVVNKVMTTKLISFQREQIKN